MSLILYTFILVILLVGFYLLKRKSHNQDFIQCVEAGPLKEVDASALSGMSYYDRPLVIRDEKGNVLDRSTYARLVVNGSCMSERGINDKDIIIAERVPQDVGIMKAELKPDSIVWLHINETGKDKIRVFEKWKDDSLVTYYFSNGQKKYSSNSHKPSQLCGIVKYKL